MARSRHKPNRRGRQPGTKVERPADPILAAAREAAANPKPTAVGFADVPAPEPAGEPEAEAETPPAATPGLPAPRLDARSAKGLSLLATAQILRVDRSILERWVKQEGAPVRRQAVGLGHGQGWEIDLADLWKWWGEHSAKEALAKAGVGVELDPKDKLALLKLAKEAQLVVPTGAVEMLLTRVMSEIRQSLTALPGRIAREMQGFPRDRVVAWKALAAGVVRETLDGARATFETLDLTASEHVTIVDEADADPQPE